MIDTEEHVDVETAEASSIVSDDEFRLKKNYHSYQQRTTVMFCNKDLQC